MTDGTHVAGLIARVEAMMTLVGEARDEIKSTGAELTLVKLQLLQTSLKLDATQAELKNTKDELTTAKNEINELKALVVRYRGGWTAIAGLAAIGGALLSAAATSISIIKFWH